MSSGVEADVALDAAVIASLGMTRVVGGAAGLAAAGLGGLANFAGQRAEARAQELENVRLYEAATGDVLDRNARIAALADAAGRHGIDLPAPYELAAQPPAELTAWCARTDPLLTDADHLLSAAIAESVASHLFAPAADASAHSAKRPAARPAADASAQSAKPPTASRAASPDATASADRTDSASAEHHAADGTDTADDRAPAGTGRGEHAAGNPGPPGLPGELAGSLARVLARLLPDASAADLAYVTEAAERVGGPEAEAYLTEVRLRVQHANDRTRTRRHDAAAAARFLHELGRAAAPHEPATPSAIPGEPATPTAAPGEASDPTARHERDVRGRLAAVAAGREPFDDTLRADAIALVARAQAQAEREYVLGAIREAFADLGYEVSEGFETLTAADGEVFLTRGDWSEHAVRLRVDEARAVRLAMVRTPGSGSDEQRRLDAERERQWCDSFEAARARLEEAGVRTDVRHRVEPGERQVPVVASRTRTKPQTRHRKRER